MGGTRQSEPRLLVIYKKTALQYTKIGDGFERLNRLIENRDLTVRHLEEEHREHLTTLQRVRHHLKLRRIPAAFRHRIQSGAHIEPFSLVVTLGGDGTLLRASHLVGSHTPMVAVNSAPSSSVGYFCAGELSNCEEILDLALAKQLERTRLSRMQVEVDEEVVSTRVLNDALFCHASPAMTCRYLISTGGLQEAHRSSGIWAGPAAGSTAAQRSAGGRILPIASKKIQYVVREPYLASEGALTLRKGCIGPGSNLEIRSQMRDGRLFFDGAHNRFQIRFGQRVRFSLSEDSLWLLGLRSRKREQSWGTKR
ncbi:MAG: NAD(+)/NADH kinase [Myxococcota bacterium]